MNTTYTKRPMGILPEEDRLVRQAKSGNGYAFAQLYDACVEQVYRYISLRVANNQVAEAVTIQVFFKAWEQLDRYQVFGPSLIMWLYSIARNQVIAYHRKHKQLKPLLQTVFLLDRGHGVMPSPTFAAFARFALIEYARSHPHQQRGVALSWQMATTLAMLIMALLVTGTTVHAQSALPGDIDYGWKRTSEQVWLVLSSDPVATDIILADRRANEWIAVADDPARSVEARRSYFEVLVRLKSMDDTQSHARIMPALQAHQEILSDAGLVVSELDAYLILQTGLPPANVVPPVSSTDSPGVSPTDVPVVKPGESSENEPPVMVPTEANSNDVPTEVVSTDGPPPTEVVSTDEPPPTEVVSTDEPQPTEVVSTDEPQPPEVVPTDEPPPPEIVPTDEPQPPDVVPTDEPPPATAPDSISTLQDSY